jgi:RNA polymerase sigma-70 factor (ECF subfamily)
MEEQSLQDTIARAQAGESAAFEALLDAYARRLYGYFFQATRRHHDAEDLLGEVQLRLVQQLNRYDHRGRFDHWLFRIAANLVRDRIRRSKTRPTPASIHAEDESGDALAQRLNAEVQDVDAGLLQAETGEQLARALEHLDATTREMILLRHFGEMSFKELAGHFDVPLGTALARVHRGLRQLRRWLSSEHTKGAAS